MGDSRTKETWWSVTEGMQEEIVVCVCVCVCVFSLGLSICKIMPFMNRDRFISSFLIWMLFIYLFCLAWLPRLKFLA